MAKAKYTKYVQPLRLWTELVRPSYRGKIADFSLLYDEKVQPETKIWVETFYIYAPGTGVGLPGEQPMLWDGKQMEPGKESAGMQHSHRDYDELFLFYGSDPADNTRLGGEVEFWLGHGADAQKFIINEPTAKWVPRGVAHNPWIVNKVNDPKHPIMVTVIALTPKYTLEPGATTNFPLPPAFSMDLIGKPQPSKGKYTELVNRLLLSQTIVLPQLRGRVCVPNLMFDDKVYRAPVWVEMFLVYAGGQGVGTPSLEGMPTQDGKTLFDPTKGMQHWQDFDELFLFVGTDPHDTLNLGGEVVTYLGDEAYSITKPSSVWVPAGVPHNPQYYKKVDRPYFMIVIALCDNAKFFDSKMEMTPAPKTFKF
ncbi:MAG TPA: hypothetical protein VF318_01340 [Dehalococcoidales bacterium]